MKLTSQEKLYQLICVASGINHDTKITDKCKEFYELVELLAEKDQVSYNNNNIQILRAKKCWSKQNKTCCLV